MSSLREKMCKFNNIFGNPGSGIHSIRLFNFAVVDVVVTIIIAYILARFMRKNIFIVTGVLFLIGIIMHRIFCVRTTVDKFLFSD